MNKRKRYSACTASLIVLVTWSTIAFAELPAPRALKEFKIDETLTVKVPADFQVQKMVDSPPTYMAVGPSPDGSGKKRPAVIYFLSAPVSEDRKREFLAAAKRAANNTMSRMGIRVTSSADVQAENGIEGTDMFAETAQGKSWWTVRTIHREKYSLQVIVGSFEKDTYDRLIDMVSDGSMFPKYKGPQPR